MLEDSSIIRKFIPTHLYEDGTGYCFSGLYCVNLGNWDRKGEGLKQFSLFETWCSLKNGRHLDVRYRDTIAGEYTFGPTNQALCASFQELSSYVEFNVHMIPLSNVHKSHHPWKQQTIRLPTFLSPIESLLCLRRFWNAARMGDVTACKA
jgi:hypothetical protein